MSKNYNAIHHIQKQLEGYDKKLVNAVCRLFNIEDQIKECQGCVIDSVVLALLFKRFNIDTELHIGEVCADGEQDAYHCWLTLDNKIIDFGIYGNANYNPFYHGVKIDYPLILEKLDFIKYCDGSTEQDSWLSELSEMPVVEYVKRCPQNRISKLFLKSLDLIETKSNQELIYDLAKDMTFPKLIKIDTSPSGKKGI